MTILSPKSLLLKRRDGVAGLRRATRCQVVANDVQQTREAIPAISQSTAKEGIRASHPFQAVFENAEHSIC